MIQCDDMLCATFKPHSPVQNTHIHLTLAHCHAHLLAPLQMDCFVSNEELSISHTHTRSHSDLETISRIDVAQYAWHLIEYMQQHQNLIFMDAFFSLCSNSRIARIEHMLFVFVFMGPLCLLSVGLCCLYALE